MFDLIVTGHRKTTRGDAVPMMISTAVHAVAIGGLVVLPLLYATNSIPEVPDMMAFVAAPPAPPPPPPPPVPARAAAAAAKPVPTSGRFAPPVDAPSEIAPEPAFDGGGEDGVPGGVEGGVPGGVLGGVVGGIPSEIPPPPPPPPPPAPRAPIRTGGEIQPPALVTRVAPVYPELAVAAQIEGMVILEAIVGIDGRVEDVRVLRSLPLLDKAAIAAVRQWRYEPLLLNGRAERFLLTVTVSFKLTRS